MESFGIVCIEGFLFRLPVVATRWRGVADVVDDGVNGFLVPINDERELAKAIETLVLDPALRKAMGDAGRRKYLNKYTLERFLSQFEDSVASVHKVEVA